jgi:anti-sigma regulatory factor (Ser/Thr protein kinase)
LYDGVGQLVDTAVPFLLDGLAVGDSAVVATGPEASGALVEALGGDPRVDVLEQSAVYRSRTPSALTAVRSLARPHRVSGRGRTRIVGEVDFGTTEAERREWQRYEAVLNDVLAGEPLWGLCVFDTRRLPDELLDTARRTHPTFASPGGRVPNPDYVDPAAYVASLPPPDEPLLRGEPLLAADDVRDPGALRHTVGRLLRRTPAPPEVRDDFLLAVDEMTSNAFRHGRPPVDVRLWAGAGRLVCTVRDAGPGPAHPFVGYGPAHGQDLSRGGMGLWLARQLTDHVEVEHDAQGVTVRLTALLG